MDNIVEERVVIGGETKIGATISYSDKSKKRPLVLLIMGTGKTDRDGNMKGFKTDIYKNLSSKYYTWFFSERKKIFPIFGQRKNVYIIRRQANNVGLLSIVITTLAHLKEAEKRGLIPVVDLQNYKNIYLEHDLIKKENSWEYFFYQTGDISLKDAYKSKNAVLSYAGELSDRPSDKIHMLNNEDGSLDDWRRIFHKYIHVKSEITYAAEEEFKNKTKLKKIDADKETIDYCYVLDKKRTLLGIVSLWKIFKFAHFLQCNRKVI